MDKKRVLTFQSPAFEREVRLELGIYNREITVEDAEKALELDLWEIYLSKEDTETLCYFKNLRILSVNSAWIEEQSFWNHFPLLEELDWEFRSCAEQISMEMFSGLSKLEYLYLSGGDLSYTRLVDLEALIPLTKLEGLSFFEFGTIDLEPLENMTQLKYLTIDYPDSVENVEVLTRMDRLEEITWYNPPSEYMEYLKNLPKGVKLEVEC